MWKMFRSEMSEGFGSIGCALMTGLAAVFGKRSHGGKVVTFAGRRWLPTCE
jgi:hypothetical protein